MDLRLAMTSEEIPSVGDTLNFKLIPNNSECKADIVRVNSSVTLDVLFTLNDFQTYRISRDMYY